MGIVKNFLIWFRKKKGINYKVVRACSNCRVDFSSLNKKSGASNYDTFYNNGGTSNNVRNGGRGYSGRKKVRTPRESNGKYNKLRRNN